jgi:MYXO-CTERM domain-containing protein
VTLDPDGAGSDAAITIGSLDWKVGNSLAVGGNQAVKNFLAGNTADTTFQVYFQAKLGNFLDAGGNTVATTGLNTAYEYTVVGALQERITGAALIGGVGVATLGFVPGGENYIKIYYDTANNANDLAGTGFSDGTLVLTAHPNFVDPTSSFTSSQNVVSNLDNFITNNYSGLQSVTGNGSSSIDASILPADATAGFFTIPGPLNINLTLFTTQNAIPFNQTDPSARFLIGGSETLSGAGNPSDSVLGIGNVNGSLGTSGGNSLQFQTDASQSFQGAPVPEPATAGLAGMGLIALGLAALRRRRV